MRGRAADSPACITVVMRLSAVPVLSDAALSSVTVALSDAVTSSSAAVRSSSREAAAGAGGRPSTDGPACGSADLTTPTTEPAGVWTDGELLRPTRGIFHVLMWFGGSVQQHGATLFQGGTLPAFPSITVRPSPRSRVPRRSLRGCAGRYWRGPRCRCTHDRRSPRYCSGLRPCTAAGSFRGRSACRSPP